MQITLWQGADFYDQQKDALSEYGWKVCKASFENSPFVKVNQPDWHFRWERDFELQKLPEWFKNSLWSDWTWTKVVLADALVYYRSISRDLLAMWADDVARNWWLPLVMSNVLDIAWADSLEQLSSCEELLDWLGEAAKEQDIVVLSWETASLSSCVGSPNPEAHLPFNWSATIFWVTHDKLKITWEKVRPWHYLVALDQPGFWSNWISKVRLAFELKYWPNWYKEAPKEEIMQALAPCNIYARAISEANGWYSDWEKKVQLDAVCHLSWWSFETKLFEPLLLKHWLSANLNNLFPICEITKKAANWLVEWWQKFWPEEMFKTWPNGQRMIVALPSQNEAEAFIDLVKPFNVNAQIAWEVTETPKWKQPQLYIDHKDLNEVFG